MFPSGLRSSVFVLRNRKGQFVPLTAMVLFTSALLMTVGLNVYRMSKSKLQLQNMADASALAVASMEAKSINTVVDRNEWLNHMYGPGYRHNANSLPNISEANNYRLKKEEQQPYANLVATVNKAQRMFKSAYDNFIGAPGGAASNGSGAAALWDILSEIDGLQDPHIISVWVYNSDLTKPSDQQIASMGLSSMNGSKLGDNMNPLKFTMEDVVLAKGKSLTRLAGGDPNDEKQRVGWMHPVWDDPNNTLKMQESKNSGAEPHFGVGVTIVKEVQLFMFGIRKVQATSMAYVVTDSGEAMLKPNQPFRPTFYARLAYHS